MALYPFFVGAAWVMVLGLATALAFFKRPGHWAYTASIATGFVAAGIVILLGLVFLFFA